MGESTAHPARRTGDHDPLSLDAPWHVGPLRAGPNGPAARAMPPNVNLYLTACPVRCIFGASRDRQCSPTHHSAPEEIPWTAPPSSSARPVSAATTRHGP